MTFDAYEGGAQRTMVNDQQLKEKVQNAALGLTGEAGEVADIIKKWLYHGKQLDFDHVIEEVGDVLWYCAQMATALGFSLNEVATRNLQKLEKRYPRGFGK